MKNLFLGLVLAISSNVALADFNVLSLASANMANSEVVSNASLEGSNYAELLSYFAKGQLPTQADLQGFWSGRSYQKGAPDQPFGMVLVAEPITTTSGGGNGPIFPPPTQTTTFNVVLANENGVSETPDRYDELSSTDQGSVEQYVASDAFHKLTSTVVDGSLVTVNEAGDLKYVVRKYQNYFISESVILKDAGDYKAGDIYVMSYFFKKVHN